MEYLILKNNPLYDAFEILNITKNIITNITNTSNRINLYTILLNFKIDEKEKGKKFKYYV